MLQRLMGAVALLACLLPATRAGAQEELIPTLQFDSAEIDYSGVELLMRFKYAPPPATTHPYLSDSIEPELKLGMTPYELTPKGGNFEVEDVPSPDPDVLWWTLRYRIDSDPRVTYDQTGFTVSWSGGPLASTESGVAVHTVSSGTNEPVTNRSRVDANGWTHLPLRTGTGVTAKTPDDPTLAGNLYAWYSPPDDDPEPDYTAYFKEHTGPGSGQPGDQEPVGYWIDRSGNERHIIQTQDSDPDLRPLLRTASSEQLGGKDVVRFDGDTSREASNLQHDTFGLDASTESFTIAMVVRVNGNPAATFGLLAWQDDGTGTGVRHLETSEDDFDPVNLGIRSLTPGGSAVNIQETDQGSPPGEALVIIMAWDPATGMNAWNLGHQTVTDSSGAPSSATGAWAFGGSGAGFNGFNGDIAEIAVYDRALDDTEAKALTAHFMDKYEIRPRTIYVNSAKADDNGTGLSTLTAKKTVAAGTDLVRTGVGDRVLFKLGSVFNPGQFTPKSGWSLDHPSVYGTYVLEEGGIGGFFLPTERPVFKIPYSAGVGIGSEGGATTTVEYVALVGLDVYSHERDPANGITEELIDAADGISFLKPDLRGIIVEDCLVRWFDYNISLAGTVGGHADDIIVRRNIVRNAYDSESGIEDKARSSGIYLQTPGSTRVLVEENVTHENGWYNNASPPTGMGDPRANIYSHNMYFQSIDPPPQGYVVRGNLSTYGASHGLQLRPGGVADSNLFYKNAIGAFAGDNSNGNESPDVPPVEPTSTPSLLWRNVFLQGRSPILVWTDPDEDGPLPGYYFEQGRNWGYDFDGGWDTLVTECIFAMPTTGVFTTDRAHAVQFATVLDEDRAYFRHNTIRVAQENAIYRDTSIENYAELRADYNMIYQPESASGVRLALWRTSLSSSGPITFDNNSYDSTGEDCDLGPPLNAEWFEHAGSELCPSGTGGWLERTNNTDSILGSEPTFADLPADLGTYYNDVLGGSSGDPDDLIAAFLSRGRSVWNEDETAAAIIDYIRLGYAPVCFNLAPDGRHYGAVPYSACLGLNGGGGGDGGCEGDFDRDGAVTAADLAAFQRAYIESHRGADLNRDGLVNVGDLAAFQSALSAGCP